MIGSMCLLVLILMYNFGWLIPVNGAEFKADVPTQTIFLISYTGLFSGIAFISSYISNIMKKHSISSEENTKFLNLQKVELSGKEAELINNKKLLEKYREIVQESAKISMLDHDLNNPLTVISLSIRRIIKAAYDYNDEKLEKSGNQMTESINKINEILIKFQKLKHLDLIQEELDKQQG